jgi:hypothetical protein
MVCPVGLASHLLLTDQAKSAYDLKKAWGEGIQLKMVDTAGHSAKEVGIKRLLTEVCAGAGWMADTGGGRICLSVMAMHTMTRHNPS